MADEYENFDAKAYLAEYYSHNPRDAGDSSDLALFWFANMYRKYQPSGKLLEFGGGPTLYTLISSAKFVDEIHFSDLSENNLQEIRDWKNERGFSWSHYVHRSLLLEDSKDTIEQREALLRKKITHICRLNIDNENFEPQYDILGMHYVVESISDTKELMTKRFVNALRLLKPNGYLFFAALKDVQSWPSGSTDFASVPVAEQDIVELFRASDIEPLEKMEEVSYHGPRDLAGFMYFLGRKG